MTESPDWNALVRGFCAGDPVHSRAFWERYGEPLRRVAESCLDKRLGRRVAPEDVVQSACRTFFRRVRHGLLELSDQETLWRLLCAITLNKVREQRRFHLRKKRGLNLEDWLGPNAIAEVNVADKEPSPEVVAEWAEQMEVVLGGLDDEQRRLVDLRLQGNTQEEIATAMEISERTVRRLTKTIQGRLNRMLENSSLH